MPWLSSLGYLRFEHEKLRNINIEKVKRMDSIHRMAIQARSSVFMNAMFGIEQLALEQAIRDERDRKKEIFVNWSTS